MAGDFAMLGPVRFRHGLDRLEDAVRQPGEFVATPPSRAPVILGDIDQLHVRVDIDAFDIPRFRSAVAASAVPRGGLAPTERKPCLPQRHPSQAAASRAMIFSSRR